MRCSSSSILLYTFFGTPCRRNCWTGEKVIFLNGRPQIVKMNWVFKVMRLHKHKNLKKVCLKENAKQFQQRRSWLVRLRQPLVPSPPLLLSRVFAAPVLLPSKPGGSWREDKVRLKEDHIFFTSDRAVHWESKLVLCTGAFSTSHVYNTSFIFPRKISNKAIS